MALCAERVNVFVCCFVTLQFEEVIKLLPLKAVKTHAVSYIGKYSISVQSMRWDVLKRYILVAVSLFSNNKLVSERTCISK